MLGVAGSLVAVWLFVLTGAVHSPVVFFLASAVAGAAYAFDFAGGLTVFSRCAAPHHRASMVSGGYLVGYVAQGVGAPALGGIVTADGLMPGLLTGATAFGLFFVLVIVAGVAVLVPLHRTSRTPEPVAAAPDLCRAGPRA